VVSVWHSLSPVCIYLPVLVPVLVLCALQCYWPNWVVGLTVCIQGVATSLGDMELQPNLIPYYIRKNDTLAAIANSFAGQCNDPDGAIVDVPSLMTAICWANGWLPAECSDRWIVIGSMILVPCAKDIGATTCSAALSTTSVSTATALSYCCGNNGVTYISYYCASSSYAIPTSVDGGGCPACGTIMYWDRGEEHFFDVWGDSPRVHGEPGVHLPAGPDGLAGLADVRGEARRWGRARRAQYARYLCSMATRSLSKIDNTNPKLSTACVNFKTCLMEAMGYKKALTSTTYGVEHFPLPLHHKAQLRGRGCVHCIRSLLLPNMASAQALPGCESGRAVSHELAGGL